MINKLLDDIVEYIEFLKREYELQISIHDANRILRHHLGGLGAYNTHNNPYCIFIKSNECAFHSCVSNQYKVLEKCKQDGSYFGMCYAGVEEYVIPVRHNGEVVAFISVSGYRTNAKRAERKMSEIAIEYCLNYSELKKLNSAFLKEEVPGWEFVKAVTAPISNMMELVYIKFFEFYGNNYLNPADLNSIYGHVLTYIEWNFRRPLTLETICKDFRCSRSLLSHFFKKQTGKSFRGYINTIRIREAKKLLLNTSIPIKEISYRTGYPDSNYFASVFKKECGVTPGMFRKNKKIFDCNSN